jgi:hypothetical protein
MSGMDNGKESTFFEALQSCLASSSTAHEPRAIARGDSPRLISTAVNSSLPLFNVFVLAIEQVPAIAWPVVKGVP